MTSEATGKAPSDEASNANGLGGTSTEDTLQKETSANGRGDTTESTAISSIDAETLKPIEFAIDYATNDTKFVDTAPSGSSPDTELVTSTGTKPVRDVPPGGWCDELQKLLEEQRQQVKVDGPRGPYVPPEVGQGLQDDIIGFAIAAVIEAISTNPPADGADPPQFALIDPGELSEMHQKRLESCNFVPAQPMARPGNEVFLLRTDGNRAGLMHNSLFFLCKVTDNRFELRSYDSANGNWHRNNSQKMANLYREYLTALGWRTDSGLQIDQTVKRFDPPARQPSGSFSCGIYVILYAWTLALGLDLSGFRSITSDRQLEFDKTAVELIILSCQGYCSSAIIEAFLKCFKVVKEDAVIPNARRFDRTFTFSDEYDVARRIARLRLQQDLDAQTDRYPPLDDILGVIDAMDPGFKKRSIWTLSIDQILTEFNTARLISETALVSKTQDETGSTEAKNTPLSKRSPTKTEGTVTTEALKNPEDNTVEADAQANNLEKLRASVHARVPAKSSALRS